jgi:hypothetical protein
VTKKPRIGTCWRILVQEPTQRIVSGNYDLLDEGVGFERGQVLDEVVIVFAPSLTQSFTQHNSTVFHLEQMNGHDWYLGIGDRGFNIHVNRKTGALELMQTQGPDVRDGR